MAQNKKILIELELNSKNAVVSAKKITAGLDNVAESSKRANKALDDTNKQMKKTAGSAGIAGAATTEFGRLISDLPYGIHAVTNNLSQMGNMFALLVTSAGGVRKAFAAMWTTIMGPVGILLAFQGIVALLEVFADKMGGAKEIALEFNSSLSEQARALDIATAKLQNQNLTLEERLNILERYNIINKKTKEQLEESGLSVDKQNEYLRIQAELIEKRRELELSRKIDEEENADREETAIEARKTMRDLEKELADLSAQKKRDEEAAYYAILGRGQTFAKEIAEPMYEKRMAKIQKQYKEIPLLQQKIKDNQTLINAANSETAEINAQIVDLERQQQNILQGKEGPAINTVEFFEQEIKTLEDKRDATATNTKQFEEYNDQIAKFELMLRRLKDGEQIPVEVILQTMGAELSDKAIVDTYFGGKKGKGIIKQGIQDQLADSIPTVDEMNSALSAKAKGGETALSLEKMLGMKDSAEKMKAHMDNVKQGLSALNEIFAAQSERDLAIEKNKTTAQNDQLRERLRNEKLTADQRDAINQQIAQNEAALIEKQNKIKEKAFKREKAMRIAMGLVDTASNALKAFGSQLVPGDPTSLARAQFAAALAAAVGMAQVIAISKQKFTPQESPSPTLLGPGTSGTGAAGGPSFNVVGASTQNQLIDAINQRNQQPVKAYVVSTEISTAQELDRKIVSGAAI